MSPAEQPRPRLGDVIAAVGEVSGSPEETAEVVAHMLQSGRLRLSRPDRCRELIESQDPLLQLLQCG